MPLAKPRRIPVRCINRLAGRRGKQRAAIAVGRHIHSHGNLCHFKDRGPGIRGPRGELFSSTRPPYGGATGNASTRRARLQSLCQGSETTIACAAAREVCVGIGATFRNASLARTSYRLRTNRDSQRVRPNRIATVDTCAVTNNNAHNPIPTHCSVDSVGDRRKMVAMDPRDPRASKFMPRAGFRLDRGRGEALGSGRTNIVITSITKRPTCYAFRTFRSEMLGSYSLHMLVNSRTPEETQGDG